MQTKVVKLDAIKIDLAKIKEAAALVDAGGLLAFPTETVYGIACRVETTSLAKLDDIKGRGPEKHYTLHIGEKNDIKKYVPTIGLKARKCVEKAWPGPLTIVFELDQQDIDKQQKKLKREIFENLYKDNSIGIRCPDNAIASILLQETSNPVVAPSANITGQKPATEPKDVLVQFSGKIQMLLDGGPCKYQKSSTVVKISQKGMEILRPGVYSQTELEALSEVKFLFVCTGNICRSPMAVGIFRKYLAKKLKCEVDLLEKMGYKLTSAGILEMAGSPASANAIAACAAKGIDIKAHKSQTLSQQLIEESDFIYGMGQAHCEQIVTLSPKSANRCVLLAENEEIPDPIGQSQEVYNNCAELIEKAVKKRVSELVL
jgi:tRNA threonylcarbamoyl adenosine modification protein (Sua5/YciO/YrdC/YwlC family)